MKTIAFVAKVDDDFERGDCRKCPFFVLTREEDKRFNLRIACAGTYGDKCPIHSIPTIDLHNCMHVGNEWFKRGDAKDTEEYIGHLLANGIRQQLLDGKYIKITKLYDVETDEWTYLATLSVANERLVEE